MPSVTQVINGISGSLPAVKQPRGGYLNPKSFKVTMPEENPKPLNEQESVTPGIVGEVVDYLTRVSTGTSVRAAFGIAFHGASMIKQGDVAQQLAENISDDLSDETINNACRLANYDAVFRAGVGLPGSRWDLPKPESINADAPTCENIRTMVNRGIRFFETYGPVTRDGITFSGGYTAKIDSGDGDFMTSDAVWDFKTNKKPPTKNHTLQICVYWLLGLHSIWVQDYLRVERLGFVNPRRNEVSTIEVADIPEETLRQIQLDVIGYSEKEVILLD